MNAQRSSFGALSDGTPVDKIELTNGNGLRVRFLTYGGILSRIEMPDRDGHVDNILCGFNSIDRYEAGHPYFGPLVGRFANRIGGASFTVDGKTYHVSANDIYGVPKGQAPKHHLHGGNIGYDKRIWGAETFEDAGCSGVVFTLESPDGEEGYPGNVSISVRCSLADDNTIELDYRATTDKATPLSLTNHAYWNLRGAGSGPILEQELTLPCPKYLVVDTELIPTGEIREVAGSPMDFREPKLIGLDIDKVPGGYDHCYCKENPESGLTPIARLQDPYTGRTLEVQTTMPAVQFYSGNFLEGVDGADGKVYEKHGALCLETQHYPDAMNHDNFPSAITRPGESYHHVTTYALSVE
jgi:aldose 1-epimerase